MLYVCRQLGSLLEVGNVHAAQQLLVQPALGNLSAQLQHRHHVAEMLQHLEFQLVRADDLASYLARHGVQAGRQAGVLALRGLCRLLVREELLPVEFQIHLHIVKLPDQRGADGVPLRIVAIVVAAGRAQRQPVEQEEGL